MKRIGKGCFTTAYLKPDGKTVFLKSVDPVKECMSAGMFPNSRLFPKITEVGHQEYEMKYYPKTKGLKAHLKPAHWEFYKELRAIFDAPKYWDIPRYDHFKKLFQTLKRKRKRAIMQEALDAVLCYTGDRDTVAFEISPRNVAVNNGNLILLDCFFDFDLMLKIRRSNYSKGAFYV